MDTSTYEAAKMFIAAHVRSVDDLHLLLAMATTPERWWDAGTAVHELGMDRRRARASIEHLAAHNLLDIRVTDDVRYQFRPGTPALEQAAGACLAVYRSNPLAVWRLAPPEKERRSIRDFADAFRLRPDDDR